MPIYRTGKNKNGKQQYRVIVCYTDALGKYKQISKCVYGSAEAKLMEMELQHKVEEGNTPSNLTLEQFYNEYLRDLSSEIRASSMAKKKSRLENHVIPALGQIRLSKLTVPMLQNWKNEISENDMMLSTKRGIYTEFNAMLNHAVKKDYMQSNPLKKLGTFKDPYNFDKPEEKIQYYTADEFKRFISAADAHKDSLTDRGYYVFFMIAFYTGMRKGEINALKWSDIDGNIISITRSVNQKLKGKGYVFTPPKNPSSVRKLQIPTSLKKVLNEHKRLQQINTSSWNEDFFICGGISCLSDTAISNKNIQFAKEAELKPIRIHDFRHTHATLLINEGISIQEIARRLGHADVTVTWKVYTHLYPREEERAVKILDNI